MGYRLSVPAQMDLDEIWNHIAENNPDAAESLMDFFAEKFSVLAVHPQIGLPCDELRPGFYRFPIGNHLVFYRIASGDIEIARVLHGARNIEEIFNPQYDDSKRS